MYIQGSTVLLLHAPHISASMYVSELQDWHDPRSSAVWRHQGAGPSPYKANPGPAPLRQIPGCDQPSSILLDYCHCFHLGYGQDLGASALVVLCKMGFFGADRAFDSRLEGAYRRYSQWLKRNKKFGSSLAEFTKKNLGMNKTLFSELIVIFHVRVTICTGGTSIHALRVCQLVEEQ